MKYWNDIDTGKDEGMICKTVSFSRKDGDVVRAYYTRPLTEGCYPGILLIPHMPGWDEFSREMARRLTQHDYAVVCPDIYRHVGTGRPDEVARKSMEAGGVSDAEVMKDAEASISFLRDSSENNGRIGVIGMCSGGRHTFMAACRLDGIDAAVDCWGGGVINQRISEKMPTAPIEYVEGLNCPLLGIFGNEDQHPAREEVDQTEEILSKHGKDYEFHRYDGAGHGIWYYDKPLYRQKQAMESFEVVMEFLAKHLK